MRQLKKQRRNIMTLDERRQAREWRQRHLTEANAASARLQKPPGLEWARILKRTLEDKPSLSHLPSLITWQLKAPRDPLAGLDYDQREDYLKRERAAQVIIEARKLMVAPAYNKGGLQLITNPEDFKTMGRKT